MRHRMYSCTLSACDPLTAAYRARGREPKALRPLIRRRCLFLALLFLMYQPLLYAMFGAVVLNGLVPAPRRQGHGRWQPIRFRLGDRAICNKTADD
jgi:hypothetical protein